MTLWYNGYYIGLSLRRSGFDSPWRCQKVPLVHRAVFLFLEPRVPAGGGEPPRAVEPGAPAGGGAGHSMRLSRV